MTAEFEATRKSPLAILEYAPRKAGRMVITPDFEATV